MRDRESVPGESLDIVNQTSVNLNWSKRRAALMVYRPWQFRTKWLA